MEELSSLVIAAQGGDLEAFGRIVTRFQDMAYAVECAMVFDSGLAQDAAQDACIDAYRAQIEPGMASEAYYLPSDLQRCIGRRPQGTNRY